MDEEQKKKCVPAEVVVLLILLMIEGVLAGVSLVFQTRTPKGYQEYTVQKNSIMWSTQSSMITGMC